MRLVVGYTKVLNAENLADYNTQKSLIETYCQNNDLACSRFYSDFGVRENRHSDEMERALALGMKPVKAKNIYPEWEYLMLACLRDEIKAIVVDHCFRLYTNKEQESVLYRICKEHNVQIIEVRHSNPPSNSVKKKVAFYHYMLPRKDANDVRTFIWNRDVALMYEVASKHSSWEATALYTDESVSKRKEYPILVKSNDFDVILTLRFYQLKRKILAFLEMSKELQDKGIRVVSVVEGEFAWLRPEDFIPTSQKVALLMVQMPNEQVDRLIKERTEAFLNVRAKNWSFHGCFENKKQVLKSSDKFDLLLVDSFNDLGDNINELSDFMLALDKPIMSLREGMIKIERNPKD